MDPLEREQRVPCQLSPLKVKLKVKLKMKVKLKVVPRLGLKPML